MSELVSSQSLQERVGQRIKEQIGELLSDDDVKRLVEAAMQQAFFTPRVERDRYGYNETTKPPYVVEMMSELVRNRMQVALAEWIENNRELVAKEIHAAIGNHAAQMFRTAIDNIFFSSFEAFKNDLRSRGLAV